MSVAYVPYTTNSGTARVITRVSASTASRKNFGTANIIGVRWFRFHRLEPIELVHAQFRLMQYAAECADSNLAVSWHNCGASASIGRSSELDMAPALADLCEACSPQSARDLTIWQRSKRHRLQPR